MISSPMPASEPRAIWFAIVPVGTHTAASLPSSAATRSCSVLTVGSSPYTSSPTSAAAIAARIPAVGRVTVSDRRSTISATRTLSPQHLRHEKRQLQRLLGVQSRVTRGLVPVGQGDVVRVELLAQLQRDVRRRGGAELDPDRVGDARHEIHVRAVEMAGALADPEVVAGQAERAATVDPGEGAVVLQGQRLVGAVER